MTNLKRIAPPNPVIASHSTHCSLRRHLAWIALCTTLCGTSRHALARGDDRPSNDRPVCRTSATTKNVTIRGRIVDEHGQPVVNATIGQGWTQLGSTFEPVLSDTSTDAQGYFELSLANPLGHNSLLAFDATRKRGALLTCNSDHPTEPYTVRIGPLVAVDIPIDSTLLPDSAWPSLNIYAAECAVPLLLYNLVGTHARITLPPGSYTLTVADYSCGRYRTSFTIPPGTRVFHVDRIVLNAREIAVRLHGEPTSWHITDARGVSKNIRLSDYRGKWVIVDFWAHWCMPCVKYSIPDLMRFYDKHADQRDQFAILMFHTSDIKDFKELDPKLEELRKSTWNGRPLPFPILLDATKQTIKQWKISGYPTILVFDPSGQLAYANSGAGRKYTIESFFAGKLRRPAARDH